MNKFDQKKTDKQAIKERQAVSNNTPGGKSGMDQLNPQKPDQNYPNLGGIKYVK